MASNTAKDEIWEALTPADLDGDLAEIARALGMEAARYLVESWGGLQIYVNAERALLRPHVREAIRRRWDGKNSSELARTYGVSRRDVMEAISESGRSLDPNQTSMDLE